MKPKRILVTAVLVLSLSGLGCQYVQRHPATTTGAGVGAATGPAAGAVLGENVQSTVVGGLLGALAGGVVGHYTHEKTSSAAETAQEYGYPTVQQGTLLQIESASAVPSDVWPGHTVDLKLSYAVLSSSPNVPLNVREIREIRHDGELVGKPEVTIQRTNGTYSSTLPLQLPSSAPKGRYSVIVTVKTERASASTETGFNVL